MRKPWMALGGMDYQVMATEGVHSTGSSSMTVWEERAPAADPPAS